jgi:DGQHR domain-containing protein
MSDGEPTETELRFPAIELRQPSKRAIYAFAVDGKTLPMFTTVSRLHRDDEEALGGYQRPEVLSHIAEIRDYIDSRNAMIPNAIVIAFDKRVTFRPSEIQPLGPANIRVGTLIVPSNPDGPHGLNPGWIVDGQQRVAAIRDAAVRHFPVFATAFISSNPDEQREQFILVNSTKPLPKGLIYELLPTTSARLPATLERKRFPAYLLERMNHDSDSPLKGMIQTPTTPGGVIKDNSVLKMLDNSLSHGALFHSDVRLSRMDADVDAMLDMLKQFWCAVRAVFSNAWGLKPRDSRLMHGVGIVGMGFVMDAIADRYHRSGGVTRERFAADLRRLERSCHWTSGEWPFIDGNRRWNDLQNTSKDIQRLANYLIREYKSRVWSRTKKIVGG